MSVLEKPTEAARPRRRAQSLAQEVATALTEKIRAGLLEPGSKLPTESQIMLEQGVSRTVVREAISSLQAAGLVETRHGVGTFVLQPKARRGGLFDPATISTMRDLLALLEFRISLETESAGLAAQRRSEEELAAIRTALREFEACLARGEDSVAADFRFHQAIAEATGNRYFIDMINHLGNAVIPRKRLNLSELVEDSAHHYLDRVQREHEDICDAIARGDGEGARAAMRNHLNNSRSRLLKAQQAAQAQS
ncbi:transcriptional regulator, GntR family [Noviherbaspirillum humi]|uniref:Transcriptional regulator, GntR family n=1 Tax=Noviherbaspirillum humi TaxID=1688639 RepID=A0A239J7X1_9BURK|nr:FadR/GntR family transcriptional regulator [Noviherbaspirillum humi]SNT01967.1 transcriptional regulator, GntR family [Noviherbaspirillum humi]